MPPGGPPGVVDDPDSQALALDDETLGQSRAELGVVRVPAHRGDRRHRLELVEDGTSGQVAHVDDERRRAQHAETAGGQGAGAARQVRVSEDGDQSRPSTKLPSRYTTSPSAWTSLPLRRSQTRSQWSADWTLPPDSG